MTIKVDTDYLKTHRKFTWMSGALSQVKENSTEAFLF